jgi:hypothetical protein
LDYRRDFRDRWRRVAGKSSTMKFATPNRCRGGHGHGHDGEQEPIALLQLTTHR